jgi:acyl carrier protein
MQTLVTPLDQIFQDLFKISPETIKDESTMADIELWDSLKHMELIVAIEQKFEIELTFEEISEMQSIGAIRRIISTRCPS